MSSVKASQRFCPTQFLLRQLGQHPEFWTQSSIQARISKALCEEYSAKDELLLPHPCEVPSNVIFLIAGFNKAQMNMVGNQR